MKSKDAKIGMYVAANDALGAVVFQITEIEGRILGVREVVNGSTTHKRKTQYQDVSIFQEATKEQLVNAGWHPQKRLTYKSLVEHIEQTIEDPKIPRGEKLDMIEEFLTNNLDRVEEES